MINFVPSTKDFSNKFDTLPFTSISNVSILNSKHSNIGVASMDMAQIQNVFIQNNTLNSNNILHPIFIGITGHVFQVNNMTVKDSVGPILYIIEVLSPQITNCFFENVSNSQQLSESNQYQIKIRHHTNLRLNQTKEKMIVIQNVSLTVIRAIISIENIRDYKILTRQIYIQ